MKVEGMIFLQKRTLEFMDKEIGNLRCCKDEILKANSNRFDSPTSAHKKAIEGYEYLPFSEYLWIRTKEAIVCSLRWISICEVV